MSIIVLLVIGWILWTSRRIIWAGIVFLTALMFLLCWEVLLQATPTLAVCIGILAAIMGAWNFMKKHT